MSAERRRLVRRGRAGTAVLELELATGGPPGIFISTTPSIGKSWTFRTTRGNDRVAKVEVNTCRGGGYTLPTEAKKRDLIPPSAAADTKRAGPRYVGVEKAEEQGKADDADATCERGRRGRRAVNVSSERKKKTVASGRNEEDRSSSPSRHRPGAAGRSVAGNDRRWYANLEKLKGFRSITGHCDVPGTYLPDKALGFWVNKQRVLRRSGRLREDRERVLEDMEFVWSVRMHGGTMVVGRRPLPQGSTRAQENKKRMEERLEDRLRELRQYREVHGNTLVPQRPSDGDKKTASLGKWVSRRRQEYARKMAGKPSPLTDDMVAALDAVGFSWRRYPGSKGPPGSQRAHQARRTWNEAFESLKKYKEWYGHLDVPQSYGPDRKLFQWVEAMRDQKARLVKVSGPDGEEKRKRAKGERDLTEVRAALLDGLGFDWAPALNPDPVAAPGENANESEMGPLPRRGDQCFDNSKHCDNDNDGLVTGLAGAVSTAKLRSESQQKRDELWETRLQEFLGYRDARGNYNVRINVLSSNGDNDHQHRELGAWVKAQRRQYKRLRSGKKTSLTKERVRILESAGFEWDATLRGLARRIEREKYDAGKKAEDNHRSLEDGGGANGSGTGENGRRPQNLKSQNVAKGYKEGSSKTAGRRRGKRPDNGTWNAMFEQLVQYREGHGDCNVKVKNNSECPVLGTWVSCLH